MTNYFVTNYFMTLFYDIVYDKLFYHRLMESYSKGNFYWTSVVFPMCYFVLVSLKLLHFQNFELSEKILAIFQTRAPGVGGWDSWGSVSHCHNLSTTAPFMKLQCNRVAKLTNGGSEIWNQLGWSKVIRFMELPQCIAAHSVMDYFTVMNQGWIVVNYIEESWLLSICASFETSSPLEQQKQCCLIGLFHCTEPQSLNKNLSIGKQIMIMLMLLWINKTPKF